MTGKHRRCWLLPLLLAAWVALMPTATQARDQAWHLPRASLVVLDDAGRERAHLSVELATTNEARARGLMFRKELPPGQGMLFLWKEPRRIAMWMKNTFIPLDMVFIAADGHVVRVHENARPHDLSLIPSGAPVIAVLEIPAGSARRYGIKPGSRLLLPAFPSASPP